MYSKSPLSYGKNENIYYNNQRSVNTSQSRIKQRMSNSPLKLPLENAINKALTPRQTNEKGHSRMLIKSRLKEERDNSSSRIISRNIYKDEPQYIRQKMHTQTSHFLKKYFSITAEFIPSQAFIQAIMRQYEHLWGSQNSNQVFEGFNYKIYEQFGENVNIRQLTKRTINDGMIGLILETFKQIKSEQKIRTSSYLEISKNPKISNLRQSFQSQLINNESLENIKNIVQQFMQTMYQCMENQLYNKFNVEMRRMVVKYREAERLIKRVNEKINAHADFFQIQSLFRSKKKQYEAVIESLKKEKEEVLRQLYREKGNLDLERRQSVKMQEQIKKLRDNLQKFQNAVLTKVMEPTSIIDSLPISRRLSTPSSGYEKQNNQQFNNQPFKITIDTHVIQKQGEAPQTKTYATLYNIGNINAGKQSFIEKLPVDNFNAESRLIQNTPLTPLTGFSNYEYSYPRSSPINQLTRKL